jgi:crossover junction endodeoxyribonuclease RuvC
MRVAGLDTSLTGTGVALVGEGAPALYTFGAKGKNTDTLYERYLRLKTLAGLVLSEVKAFQPDLVVIEKPAYAAKGGHPHDRSGLWWLIVAVLSGMIPVMEVNPGTRMMYATGKGKADKEVVTLAVARRYNHITVTNNNEADALVLAMIGLRLTGHPADDPLPQTHLAAMITLQLPKEFHG